jgi:hypothetical protein
VYAEPIIVISSEKLKAVAIAPGYGQSSIASALYTID